MHKFLGFAAPVLIFAALFAGLDGFPKLASPALATESSQSDIGQSMVPDLAALSELFSHEHSFHWNHPTLHMGHVTTAMTYAPVNFDGCTVTWTQTQEGLASDLIYIATRRFSVPLPLMDPKKITVDPIGAGSDIRPGIEPGDYFTVRLETAGGNKVVSVVDNDIEFNNKKGPISTVYQLRVSDAWVRVRREETGELIKAQFQKTIGACVAAGQ